VLSSDGTEMDLSAWWGTIEEKLKAMNFVFQVSCVKCKFFEFEELLLY